MKKFLKHYIKLSRTSEINNDLPELYEFEKDNVLLLHSFNTQLQKYINKPYYFNSTDSFVSLVSKSENSYELKVPFFLDNEEVGTASVILITRKPSDMFIKLFKKNLKIDYIFLDNSKIGVVYYTSNGCLDYYYEENTLENAFVRNVIVDIDQLKSVGPTI